MMAVINLITANGKMSCVQSLRTCVCLSCVHVSFFVHVSVLIPLLVNAVLLMAAAQHE